MAGCGWRTSFGESERVDSKVEWSSLRYNIVPRLPPAAYQRRASGQ